MTNALQNVTKAWNCVAARAILVGSRIDTKGLTNHARIALHPLVVVVEGGGIAAVFRYGVVVFFNVNKKAEHQFLSTLEPLVHQPRGNPDTEELRIHINIEKPEGIGDDIVNIHDASPERMQVIAIVLSRSVVLAEYERQLAASFDFIEPIAMNLEHGGTARRSKELLRHIGSSLLSELKMVGRVEMREKPELLWERPDLDSLFSRIEDEFEIQDRHGLLNRKLELISRTVRTVLDISNHRHSLRVEWYIVILILVEIALFVYELFFRH